MRRERLSFCPQAAKRDDEGPFSLRDSETLGNIGVVGVLATAVVVGGALVIFNPYAGQNIKQETIKVAKVPEPLPSKSKATVKAAAAPNVAAKPTPAPAPKKPTPVPTPAPVAKKAPSRSDTGGIDTISLVGGLAVVAAVGGGVAYFSQNFSENGTQQAPVAATDAEMPSTDANTPPTEGATENASSEGTPPPPDAEDARTWISEWRNSQK